ncbi:non-homologous end joining protein Ku [Arthrobacter sp. H14]|uniref:non-homologous end joining protein Ku n=1 Tax=Arthrobacter sp. H14 TaxID=1312959 RepID=UPI00047D013B|nr:Ku protein [Arthrobacter sp. H14]
MRAIWKGAIAFGLVNVPVKVYSATENHDIRLHQVHDKDGGRIRYQRHCEVCGEVVEYQHIDKAYDDGDRTVVLTDEDFDSLPVEKSREIDVVEFVPSEQVDSIMFDKAYYLEPDSKSSKAYVLLRRTLEETDRTAIVKFTLRQKSRLAALRVRDDVLMIQTLLWEDEVREASFPSLDEKVKVSDKELKMSSALVDSFSSDFTPEEFTDEYQEQLQELVEAKLEKGEGYDTEETFGETGEEEEGGAKVLDLMEALRRSVEKNRGSSAAADTSDDSDEEDEDDEEEAPKQSSGSKSKSSGGSKSSKSASSKSGSSKSSDSKSTGKSAGSKSSKSKSSSSDKDKDDKDGESKSASKTRQKKGA